MQEETDWGGSSTRSMRGLISQSISSGISPSS